MKRRAFLIPVMILVLVGLSVQAADIDDAVNSLLKSGGAVEFSEKSPYGAGIDRLVLGYDAEGSPAMGVAVRETKTYKKVHTVVALEVADGSYKISAAEVPDLDAVPGKAKTYVKDALKDITGRVVADTKEAREIVDAVTGASKYYKAIYVSYSLMSTKLIEEIEANPDWERKPVSE